MQVSTAESVGGNTVEMVSSMGKLCLDCLGAGGECVVSILRGLEEDKR